MYDPQIKTFISVAENGSFSKAAETLFVTPTAVMKQINSLEKKLAVTLFDRTNHGLSLTAAGESLFRDAKFITDYSARAVENAREIDRRENQKSIRIGASVMTPAKFVLDIWERIEKAAPSLKFEIIPFVNTPENARGILGSLGKQIDIVAGIYDDRFLRENGVRVLPLQSKRLLLAVPVSNPLARKDTVSLRDLENKRVMLVDKGWNIYMDQMRNLLEGGGAQIIDFDFFGLNAFNRAVKENIPIVAVEGWENIHPLLKIIPVAWDCRIPYGILHPKEPSKQVRRLIGIIRDVTECL